MKKLWIEPGCIACGTCAFTAPDIFEVTDQSRIKKDAPVEHHYDAVLEAVKRCPVSVIKTELGDQ